MKMREKRDKTYEFGEYRLNAEQLLLFKEKEIVPLAPKAVEVLLALVENSGEVISKDELMNQVWSDSFVEEANLTQHVSALRKALGEDKNGRKFIETIPRKGYRFVVEVRNGAKSETAEIVISERARVQIVEETNFATNNLAGNAGKVSADSHAAPDFALPPSPSTKNKRRLFLTAAAAGIILLIGAAVIAYRSFSSANKSAPPEISFKRLTPDADTTAPSISPDGASIAYVRYENGQISLWRKQINSGALTQLTPIAAAKDVEIPSTRFSPDGKWIYFSQSLAGETEKVLTIYRIPAGGGAAQKILSGLDFAADFSISPDSRQIAYTSDWRQVIVADIGTGNKQVIVDWDGESKYVRTDENSVAWSPDGARLIFSGGTSDPNHEIYQMFEINLNNKDLRKIPVSENFQAHQIECLPDDSNLIVTRFNKLRYDIWRVNRQTGESRRISNGTDSFLSLRISADFKTLVAQQSLGQYNVWTVPADNTDRRRQITIGASAQHGTDGLTQMPDGRILYTSIESGATDIWTMKADGGERKQLTVNAGVFNGKPQPTKGGHYIVFLSNRSGTKQVWRMDADGGNPIQLSVSSENYDYSLSPEDDVYYIKFLADEQKYQIYKIPVTGGEPTRIDDFYTVTVPIFSPDGKWILFFGGITKDDKPRVGIIERATGKVVRYFDNSFTARGWMPDSKSIVDTRANGQELWRQPIDGGAAVKLYDFSPLKLANWNFSADGKRIVLSLGNSTSEAVLIQNFSEDADLK